MARSWCKVSSQLDTHPKIRRAGNLGRQVFEFALRRNADIDRGGIVPAEHFDSTYLADVLMLTEEQALSGLKSCVRTGLLSEDGDNFVITGWDDEWGKRPMTEAERKRNQRANHRNSTTVTKRPDTKVDGPESHASEERRGEENRGEEKKGVAGPADRRPSKSKPKDEPLGTPTELASVARILSRMSELTGHEYRGAKPHVQRIVARLREGITEGDMRAVVAYCDDDWSKTPGMDRFMRPETLFGPETIHKYLPGARAKYRDDIAKVDRENAAQPHLEGV
jgi:uncharacterized phage protein (TIGR02220 family)